MTGDRRVGVTLARLLARGLLVTVAVIAGPQLLVGGCRSTSRTAPPSPTVPPGPTTTAAC